jgi:hypothetical protein
MLSPLAIDIFNKKYRQNMTEEKFLSLLEKGNELLETKGIGDLSNYNDYKPLIIALEYREAYLKDLIKQHQEG